MTIITFEVIVPLLIALLAAWAFITQLVLPAIRGTRLFPALAKPHLDLVDELAKVDEEIETEHLRQQLAAKTAALNQERSSHGQ